MALFYLSNGTVSAPSGGDTPMFIFLISNGTMLKLYLLFIALEFLFFLVLFWKEHSRDVVFYAASLELFLLPMFFVISGDFCMRVSVPALCLLSLFSIKFLISDETHSYGKIRKYLLILILIIGAVTPIVEIGGGCYLACKVKMKYWRLNQIYSFTIKESMQHGFGNFVSIDASRKFFFRYLAKPPVTQFFEQQK